MRKIMVTAKTVDEAVQQGLEQLKTTLNRVKVDIIEKDAKGIIFGIGSKEAKIEMEIIEDPVEDALQFLQQIFDSLELELNVEVQQSDEGTLLSMSGEDLGMIIGRRGQTLDSLQYLLNIVANRYTNQQVRFILDAENFREKRKKTLQRLATHLASQVIKTKKSVQLEPMSALERKIIHTQLQDHPKVKTISDGDEPYRYVIISLK